MVKAIKILSLSATALLLALPAVARITPVHEYSLRHLGPLALPNLTCSSVKYFDEPTHNATCQTVNLTKDLSCWKKCSCSSSYPYTESGTKACNTYDKDGNLAIVPGTEYCQPATNTDKFGAKQYSECVCNAAKNFVDIGEYNLHSAFNYYDAENTDSNLHCINTSNWSCADGYVAIDNSKIVNPTVNGAQITFNANGESQLIKYTGFVNTKTYKQNTSLVCAKADGVTIDEPLYKVGSRPTINCVETATGNTVFFGIAYEYFKNSCSDDGNCATSFQDCINYTERKTTWYDPSAMGAGGTVTCHEATSCLKSAAANYVCVGGSDFSVDSSKINSVDYTHGSYTCRKVTGCQGDYTLYAHGSVTSLDELNTKITEAINLEATNPVDMQTYTVYANDTSGYKNYVEASATSYPYFICRTASGCRIDQGYYDMTCSGGCWNGMLSWWRKDN